MEEKKEEKRKEFHRRGDQVVYAGVWKGRHGESLQGVNLIVSNPCSYRGDTALVECEYTPQGSTKPAKIGLQRELLPVVRKA